MENLKFIIGGVQISPESRDVKDSDDATKFIVGIDERLRKRLGIEDPILTFYAGGFRINAHADIPEAYGLLYEHLHNSLDNEKKYIKNEESDISIVGGGRIYVNKERNLVLDGLSQIFGAVPKKILEKFGELLLPRINKDIIIKKKYSESYSRLEKINGIISQPYTKDGELLNEYWKQLGFKD